MSAVRQDLEGTERRIHCRFGNNPGLPVFSPRRAVETAGIAVGETMTIVHFVFIGEGSSDDGLIPHLRNLCIELGADEVTGVPLDFQRLDDHIGSTVESKLRAALQLEPNANLYYLHRDADSRDPQPRYNEISAAVAAT